MVDVNVHIINTSGESSASTSEWKGSFTTVPRVGDILVRDAEVDPFTYKVVKVVMADGVPEPMVFCVIDPDPSVM